MQEVNNNGVQITPDALVKTPKHRLPFDYFMPELQKLILTLQACMNCSMDIITSTVFAVISGAVGNVVAIREGIYTNRLNLNLCHVAPPGSNKTQPVSKLVKPLALISHEMLEDSKRERENCKEAKEQVAIPPFQILYISNPTPEAINKTLANNQRGLFVRRDELPGFIEDLQGRYSKGSGIPDFLSYFSNEPITILRVGEQPLEVSNPYLTVVGGIQPGILPRVLGYQRLLDDGFTFRWLFCVPEIEVSLERSHEQIDDSLLDWWEVLVRRFHNMAPMAMTFDKDASKLLDGYHRRIAIQRINGADSYMCQVRDKLEIYVQKFAGLATLLHGECIDFFANKPRFLMSEHFVNDKPCEPVIKADAVEYAIRCMDVFEAWAEDVRDLIFNAQAKHDISLADAIKALNKFHPIINKKQFAESCGMAREQLYKYIGKENDKVTPKNIQEAEKQKD